MPLTHEQAFKVGFLQRCAQEGLTTSETLLRIKVAMEAMQPNPLVQPVNPLGPRGGGPAPTTPPAGFKPVMPNAKPMPPAMPQPTGVRGRGPNPLIQPVNPLGPRGGGPAPVPMPKISMFNAKQAAWPLLLAPLAYAGAKAMDLGTEAVKALPGLAGAAMTAGVAVPVGVGAAGGLAAAKLTGSSRNAIDEAKQDEIMGEYERLADEARRRTRLKRLQNMTGRRVIALSPEEQV